MAGGSVHIPWYATGFRGDKLEEALADIAPLALRYGATSYAVFRYHDDRYKFLQVVEFPDTAAWEAYWEGPDFIDWRIANQSYFQVPVVYGKTDVVIRGEMRPETLTAGSVDSEPGASDAVLDAAGDRAGTLVCVEDAEGLRFDVRLQGEGETVFLATER